MKLVKTLFILVILALAVAPYGVGFYLQQQYELSMQRMNELGGGVVRFDGKFERGYLTSKAHTEIKVLNGAYTIKLEHHVYQGPVIFHVAGLANVGSYIPRGFMVAQVDTKIVGKLAEEIKKIYKDKPAYDIHGEMAFDGSAVVRIKNHPVTVEEGETRISWGGFDATVHRATNLAELTAMFMAPSLSLENIVAPDSTSDYEASLTITNLRIDLQRDFVVGSGGENFSIDSIIVTEQNKNIFGIEKLALSKTDQLINNLLSATVTYSFDRAFVTESTASEDTAEKVYGPLKMKLKVSNIDVKTISDFYKKQLEMNQGDVTAPDYSQQLMKMSATDSVKLLMSRPEVVTDLSFTDENGTITAQSSIAIGGPDVANGLTMQTLNPVASASLSMSQASLDKLLSKFAIHNLYRSQKTTGEISSEDFDTLIYSWVAKMSAYLQENNYLVKQGEELQSKMQYNDGAFVVNDVPRDLDDIVQLQEQFVLDPQHVPPAVNSTPTAPSDATIETPNTTDTDATTEMPNTIDTDATTEMPNTIDTGATTEMPNTMHTEATTETSSSNGAE